MRAKPILLWGVTDAHGQLVPDSVSSTRAVACAAALETHPHYPIYGRIILSSQVVERWGQLYRRGYRTCRVRVTKVGT